MIAQNASRRAEAALKTRSSSRSRAVDCAPVGCKQARVLVLGESRVGRDAGEVEQGVAHARVFPVHQPEPVVLGDQVGGQQVVVAERGAERTDARRPARGSRPGDRPGSPGAGRSDAVAVWAYVRIVWNGQK